MNATHALPTGFDPLPEIMGIVRSAIRDGLIKSETLEEFDLKVESLKGPALEDYLQTLWDHL